MKEKTIPHSIEAEQAVLGSMFLTKYALQKAVESIGSNSLSRHPFFSNKGLG